MENILNYPDINYDSDSNEEIFFTQRLKKDKSFLIHWKRIKKNKKTAENSAWTFVWNVLKTVISIQKPFLIFYDISVLFSIFPYIFVFLYPIII